MHHITLALLLFSSLLTSGQQVKKLEGVSGKDTIRSADAVIYGLFIQRLGFSSGGFPQDICIVNIKTNEAFSFKVKPTFKSAKENTFCYHIPSGKYWILQYWWTQSKWYGGKMYQEPVLKKAHTPGDKSNPSNELQDNIDSLRYTFSIESNSLNYLGTWDFTKELVKFYDDKTNLDKKLLEKYINLDFINAIVEIPR